MHNDLAFGSEFPPSWSLNRPKTALQSVYDFLGSPLRMILLPDMASERLHLTSLRAERFAAILPRLRGRVLDVGAGDNMLCRLYRDLAPALGVSSEDAQASVGVDIEDWNGQCTLIENAADLPFDDNSFDTICFVACINHITNRVEALQEARRLLRPGGQLLVTMIGPFVGTIGHAIWWYSEDKHREVDDAEKMGMSSKEIIGILNQTGFKKVSINSFVYGLNRLYIANA
ncbi:methyltransferase domain-containing protein [Rhizobium sp. BK376]|uniref:methyltransferase domain-containing protein n=1 Tax=Rhizobium sp. BK376 TaxID=2512149 RepID=UPI00104B168F|nr:methyltransferase domain-containing protein [Rhizobium sp. BK376]TCR66938.1 ubiquinone/menaquinone biosynthesis C-methylase UbiE [Rhizobium sp. BK376]